MFLLLMEGTLRSPSEWDLGWKCWLEAQEDFKRLKSYRRMCFLVVPMLENVHVIVCCTQS
jgi:hypothetical protein